MVKWIRKIEKYHQAGTPEKENSFLMSSKVLRSHNPINDENMYMNDEMLPLLNMLFHSRAICVEIRLNLHFFNIRFWHM